STLFNRLTGLRQKVANYPGVTVEKKLGDVRLADGRELTLVDLPGLHGFSAKSLDERVTRDVLEGRLPGLPAPDAVVLIVDSTRLESQLMLVEPVLEMGLPTLLVLNMADELAAGAGRVDEGELAARLGVSVVAAAARTGAGMDRVQSFLESVRTRPAADAAPANGSTRAHADTAASVHAGNDAKKRVDLPVVDVF